MLKRLITGVSVLLFVVLGGTLGYYFIGDGRWSLGDCLYMTVVTISTVGYGETLDGMDKLQYARGFTMILIVFGSGGMVYFISTITAFIIEGDINKALFANKLKKRIKRMKDHVIVCGAGSTGYNVIEELLKTGVSVVAIDTNEAKLRDLADKHPKASFSFIIGDATEDPIMNQANLEAARGLVAALSSDKDNLYLVVSARQQNSHLRIIARCAEVGHVEKIKRSGADSVVSPNYIGGMRMVSELMRPAVVRFLDDMLRDKRAAYRIEEVRLGDRIKDVGGTLGDAHIRKRFGMTVLAMQRTLEEPWIYNPDSTETLATGTTLVVLGSADQVKALRDQVG